MGTRHGSHAGGLVAADERRCRGGFPCWALWLIWPAIWLVRGASAAAAPLLAALTQPIALGITPLPLLLIGAGVALLLLDRTQEGGRQ